MIADARAKLHQLMTGRLAVKVTIEGQETEFNRASIPQLRAYIKELEAELAGLPTSGAIGFWL